MLNQQDSFKLGEWAPATAGYYCVACDRNQVDTTIEVETAQPFPFCPACKEAGREEVDQLWVRVADRDAWRLREKTRWRELWKV